MTWDHNPAMHLMMTWLNLYDALNDELPLLKSGSYTFCIISSRAQAYHSQSQMSKMFSKRLVAMKNIVLDQLGAPDQAWTDCLAVDKNREMIQNFLDGVGPPKILVYFQMPEEQQEEPAHEPVLLFTYGDTVKIKNKGVYFVRNLPENKKTVNTNEASDNEVFWGELIPNPIKIISVMMESVYEPLINSEKNDFEWGLADGESQDEFRSYTEKFKNELQEALDLMSPSQDFFKLEEHEVERIAKLSDDEKINAYEHIFDNWIKKIEEMLTVDVEPKKEDVNGAVDVGPRTELNHWRTRMQNITNWSEQLKSADFVHVKTELMRSKHSGEGKKDGQENITKLINNFNRLDLTLTEKLNEAKDNVKYLSTLEKFLDPLYHGTTEQIIETLPSLMNAIKMIHTIARFYNTTDKMTGLFVKITDQMIKNCKDRIIPGGQDKTGDIWKRDPQQIIKLLSSCIKLNKDYKDIYKATKEKVADMPKGKTFDFSEIQIFSKFDQFVKRLRKIIDIFENILQFNDLNKHNLEGMEGLTARFNSIFDEFKKKRTTDLLNMNKTEFDRDYVQFGVDISKLDTDMQTFIDNCFNRFLNVEYSLKLVKKFENTLKRDALKHKLGQKYSSILHTYSTELDAISKIFQESRNEPPIVRNVPETAGKIIWSKHLFEKISGPINKFENGIVGNSELKRYFSSYNSLGKQLTIHQMWYFIVWSNDIERSKAALQAALITRNEKKQLQVNFHNDISQLIRESKVLDRQGIKIPESARIILLQEDKFKMYNNELLFLLKEYDRIVNKIKPICKDLLSQHIADLELKINPGTTTLTWTSMNIDSFLTNVHQGLSRLEQLIINVNDIIENRIESNLKLISKIILVQLPEGDSTFTLENFVTMQEQYINEKRRMMTAKNIEIEKAVDDLIKAILVYQIDPRVEPVKSDNIKKLQKYYFWFLYQSLLNATQNSLNAMKHRICGAKGTSSQKLNPFFEVDVQLEGNEVKLSPSLESIQKAINKAATTVLRCSKTLYNWNKEDILEGKKTSLYDMIAQDKQIVKVILLLTGSIQGTKNKVNDFLSKFTKYEWIWKQNVFKTLKEFQEDAQLQSYELKLKQFKNIEHEIEHIEPTFVIGAMVLKTNNLCHSMKQQCKDWTYHYSEDLHRKAKNELEYLTEQIKEIREKLLKTQVKDIDSLGIVMEKLEEIRNMQTVIDIKFNPVLEMYSLLDEYLLPGNIDKDEMDHRSMLKRNWDSLVLESERISNNLTVKQAEYLKQLKQNVKQLVKDVQEFREDYEKNGPMADNIEPQEANKRLKRFCEQYEVREQEFIINAKGEDLFGLQNQRYPSLEKTKAELANLKKLYDLYNEVISFINGFQECSWSEITIAKLNENDESAKKFRELCNTLPKDLRDWKAYKELKNSIENMLGLLPIIANLKKDSIETRHWEQLNEKTTYHIPFQTTETFIIEDLIKANVLDLAEDIEEIADSADKQRKIRNIIAEMRDRWNYNDFEFANWGKRENCILKASVQELSEILEEDQMTLSSINAQRHVAPFKKEVEEMIRTFSDCSEIIDLWIKVQKLWISLEPVFTGGDIAKQMPQQAKTFLGIDKTWIRCMDKAFEIKKVIGCCQSEMLKESLPDMQKKLEDCQKMLEAYLEGKRKLFPRFYFVSNPNLLKILSMGSEPNSIQEDFEKLFDAITKVEFGKDTEKKGSTVKVIKNIIQEMGSDMEVVQLKTPVRCENNIEQWLARLEFEMQTSIRALGSQASSSCSQIINSLGDAKDQIRVNENKLANMLKSQISQISLLSIQLIWTTKMTEIFEQKEKQSTRSESTKKGFAEYMMNVLTAMCLQEIEKAVDRKKIETLVTIQVHQKDITETLKTNINVYDFDWQKQTRVYWRDEIDHCVVAITDFEQNYTYEFLGAKERLCITMLTDRCYITLAQALSMYYGGAPAGPAGTGKTETVKDLGRTLGIFVVVTNCSDQHRYKDMAKIFKGLVQSGLWGCFDEFNRIDLEVLSVVAMQVESIGLAKKQGATMFMFPEEVDKIKIVPSVGYFITMNPGYAGRQELPENLKVLFRGVTMMVPDREVIIKVKLASVGFSVASYESLCKKFNVLYKLCEEQLSKQRHYDFGLRNILSVLRTAGNTKRAESKSFEACGDNKAQKEALQQKLLMRSLRDMNESKLVEDDQPLFADLLADIFPKQTNVEKKVYKDVETAIPKVIEKKKELVQHPLFVKKIIQLYETSLVRHGFMLVGNTGTGKTTIMNVLTETLTEIGKQYKIIRMNPKAITDKEMYGVKSEMSDDWIQGVFSKIWERANVKSNKFVTWITCDGPVDAIWIENLNTVLDDNKILTLANGERIPMTDLCKLVFEVENLNNASPATVSRCGQVFVSPGDLPTNCIYEGWCELRKYERGAEEANLLLKYLTKYFTQLDIIKAINKTIKSPPVMAVEAPIKVSNTINLINGMLPSGKVFSDKDKDYEKVVVFAISWAIGGLYEANQRYQFHQLLLSLGAPLPTIKREKDTIFDFFVYFEDNKAEYRAIEVEKWRPPQKGNVKFSQLFLPTPDSWKADFLIRSILKQPEPYSQTAFKLNAVLLVGGSGTAKTCSVLMYSNTFDAGMVFKRINFSSATSPANFQAIIEAECDSKVGKNYAPPGGKQMTVFIDDMSMPFVNKWGDQVTLEVVRQLIEQGGFYWLDKAQRGNFKNIRNLKYIGAMNHPGGGKNDIPNRLKRQHFIFNMILPLSVEEIYGPIIKYQFRVDAKNSGLTEEVKRIIDCLTSCTIRLWDQVKKYMLPTPSKFHYVFNMRELARIFKGVLQIKRETIMKTRRMDNIKPETYLVGLWRHECQRVFVDKLTNVKDKNQVEGTIEEILTHNFNLEAEVNKDLKGKSIYFLDYMATDTHDEEGTITEYGVREYEAVSKIEDIRKRCYIAIDDYNNDTGSKAGKRLELVLFDDAIQHLLRISRIIKMPRSSALLVGVGGSGKQSVTRLASYIGRMETRQIVLAKNYGDKELREDIKEYFKISGHFGRQTCFILTDAEVKKEDFLEYINMILSTGEIAGLFAKDEREVILADVRNDYVKEKNDKNIEPTANELYSYFVERTRDNLHVVLCFSPVGQKFRDRSRKFPALFNECTIDWFLTWPEEALVNVAQTEIRKFKDLQATEEIKLELMKHMGNVHVMVRDICEDYYNKLRRQVYVTPKSFLSYLKSYSILYKKKFIELDKNERNYRDGVRKIDDAAESIAIMKVSLKEEEALLRDASHKCENILNNLHTEQRKAQIKEREVAQTAASCEKQAAEIAVVKAEAQKDLEAAQPALIKAAQALGGLDAKVIAEMKSTPKMHLFVQIVLDTICILLGLRVNPIALCETTELVKGVVSSNIIKPSWEESGRSTLFGMGFLKSLVDFPKDRINNQTIELLQPYKNQEYFKEDNATKQSAATCCLLKWVSAIMEYHEKSQIVKPKKIKLVQEEARLQLANEELKQAKKELQVITDYLNELDANSSRQIEKKNQLQLKSQRTKKKINTAETLISSLGDEKLRWKNGAEDIKEEKRKLVGNCSLATAFISYCGPFNSDFRSILSTKFVDDMKLKKVPVKETLANELTKFLVDQATVGEWNLQGLPKDDLSVQNGIMVTNSTRYPLLIDPQGQGQNWIMRKYAESIEKNHSICTMTSNKFKDHLKYCIEEGKTFIIENIENEVDPMMDPVLEKQVIYKKKGNGTIEIGGQVFEYNAAFLLFMTCRLSNPSFSPELSAKTTIIDFAVTQKGLEQQLLGKVISKEQKALEDSLNQLLLDVNFNTKELKKLDQDLLQRLSESKGNLLEDKDLMDVLNSTKTQSKEVTIKLKDSQVKTAQINEKREQYRPVAIRGAALYFTMIEVALVNWMYNSSLDQFLNLFNESIDCSEKAQNPTKRVENIIKHLTKNIYRYVNRGLFEKDKITYILMICFKILITAGRINGNDVSLFLKAGAAEDIKFKPKPSGASLDWLNGGPGDKIWLNLVAFSKHCFNDGIAIFKDLPELIQKNSPAWRKFYDENEPEVYSPIPDINEKILLEKESSFIKMCLVRSIREDRTIMAVNNFIKDTLGDEYVKPISYPIETVWLESTPYIPVLFLLSAGADPTSAIDEFARKKKKFPVDKVSMGEGQEETAKKAISAKLEDGGWVVLQNCHLGLKYMEEIDQMLISWLQGESTVKPHPEFRLWITCEQHPLFPLGLLQKTIKVTNEPPKGVKAGLHKTYSTIINTDFLEKVENTIWKNIIFTVCFLHSILIERRKFGPLGWCVPYEFNNSDLEASLSFVEKYISSLIPQSSSTASSTVTINNNVIRYMICEVQYGGRVTDDLDRELLNSFGEKYLVEAAYNSAGTEYVFVDTGKFKYKIPNSSGAEMSTYLNFINDMPGSDQPELFGLHSNADLTFRQKESMEMIATIMDTRPKEGSSSGGKTREELVKEKAKDMSAKLPADYVESEVREQIKKLPGPKSLGYGMSVPLNIFLFQEIQRMQKVIGIVRKTLLDVVDAIDGQIIMTPDILDAINAIDDAKVPAQWLYDATGVEISWIFPSLGVWNSNLYNRNKELSEWLRSNRPPHFWLGGFFNPQGFLTAMKQEVTRMHKGGMSKTGTEAAWSLDDVTIKSSAKDKDSEVISDGVYIRSLFIEGCSFRFNNSSFQLEDSKPRKLFQEIPYLQVVAFQNKKTSRDAGGSKVEEKAMNQYNCPVYKYPRRTDKYIIFRANLTCESGSFTKWKQRGVALLCAIE